MGFGSRDALATLSVVLGLLLAVGVARAQGSAEAAAPARSTPSALVGRNIEKIEVVFDQPLWSTRIILSGVRVGQTFTSEVARRALDELARTGRFGELRAEAHPVGAGVLLRLHVTARRVLAAVRLSGIDGDRDELLRVAGLRAGAEVTARELPLQVARLEEELARRGFPDARVRVSTLDTDDPLAVVLVLEVTPGPVLRVTDRRFYVWPDPKAPGLAALLDKYAVGRGDRGSVDSIESADRALEQALRAAGYFEARVEHRLIRSGLALRLEVRVYAGSLVRVRFEGNRRFDARELLAALELEETSDRTPSAFAERIHDLYVARGFFDVRVDPLEPGTSSSSVRELVLRIREGDRVRVTARQYPCLTGERSAAEVGSEIDSFLSELPGGTLIDAVDPARVDALFGPKHGAGYRPKPRELNPWSVYSPEVYERALEHLQDLYRAEGYLSASVGAVQVVRRTCDIRSPPGVCITKTPRVAPAAECRYDPSGIPVATAEEDADPRPFCIEDPARGVRCEPEVLLSIPIQLGPRSHMAEIEMDGNLVLTDEALRRAADLTLGAPVSQNAIDQARRRLLDLYAEEGFAFAQIEVDLDLSPDHQRARVRFVISERKQVRVSRIVVRGARITSESVIRRRLAVEQGELYRRSLVRKTEERLATLGVFSSVTVGFEDPYVPASQKVVVVTVQEKKPQYLDVRPGFSTGEGFRITFEYGHRNLGGQAIQLTLRSQLGFLPSALILEDEVRAQYEQLDALERLERRNTATIEFPDVGLGPLFRLSLEGVDVRDNARDFGLTKDAGIAALFFLPERGISFQIGGSLERNDARIFRASEAALLTSGLLRVPQGLTFVVSELFGATWERRDNPLDATRGTYVSASVEHVQARPVGSSSSRQRGAGSCDPGDSWFLRYNNRLAGYVRLSKRGLALATSFRWGLNHQLCKASRTYPDRLFFLGGVDSLRGFLQDSLIPEDVAREVLSGRSIPAQRIGTGPSSVFAPPRARLRADQVVIRGGDLFINPRVELRIPLNESVQTAIFLDAGNLWADSATFFDDFRLRYATGTGLRVGTPIGPLVFDYGFNVDRVLDALLSSRGPERYWEDIGAFHFSIGLF